ncbi:MAG: alpha/beta hydrolase [Litorimonas sp.]
MTFFRTIIFILSAQFIVSCASVQSRHPDFGQDCESLAPAGLGQAVDCVRVFYGTNRSVNSSGLMSATTELDAGKIDSQDSGKLTFGRADIWLPKLVEDGGSRELGDTPLLKGDYPDDKDELNTYVFVTRITKNGRQNFVEKLGADMSARGTDGILLFVHGFNVGFEDALIRSAQLTVDLGNGTLPKPGSPVLFSWPSAGKMSLGHYKNDGKQAASAVPHLEAFLDVLTTDMEISKINIVAHSMGNRVLIGALEQYAADYLEAHPEQDIEFRIVLAAADVDRDIFDLVAGKLDNLKPNVVIYTSDDDVALKVSKLINGTPRLGDTDKNKPYIRVSSKYETVDATSVASELFGLGHGYYSSNPFILGDIRCALGDQIAEDRALKPRRYDDKEDGLEFFQTDEEIDPFFEDCALVRSRLPNQNGSLRVIEQSGSGRGISGSGVSGSGEGGGGLGSGTATPPPTIGAPPPAPVFIPPAEPLPFEETAPLQRISENMIFFESGQARLTEDQKNQIQQLIDSGTIQSVTIQGFTDSSGNADLNLRLSNLRAQNTANIFVDAGLPVESISVLGLGETEPLVETADGVSEGLNRRVVITIIYLEDR